MRDAFGGVFTMNFLLVFIFIYIAFVAVSLNYARAFRLKNAVIDFVEQNEIKNLEDYFGTGGHTSDSLTKLDNLLEKYSYHKTCDSLGYTEGETIEDTDAYCYKGVVFNPKKSELIKGTNSKIVYYQVITYADWELGALNKLLALAGRGENSEPAIRGTWSVKGEAKVVIKE